MGLDIFHIKATFDKPQSENPYDITGMTEDKFEGFDVPFSHFEKYIQKIDHAEVLKTAFIVKEEKYVQETLEQFQMYGDTIIFEKNPIELNRIVENYIRKNHLNHLIEYRNDSYEKWTILYHYEIVQKIGFYEKEVGYQRKGMNGNFKYFYQEGKTEFVLREDFERAYDCIDFYWHSDTAM